MNPRLRHQLACIVILVLAAAQGACSGSPNDTSNGAAGTTSAAVPASTVPPPTGEPLRLGTFCLLSGSVVYTECKLVVDAIAKKVNAEGGVRGRPVEFVTCDVTVSVPQSVPNCISKTVEQDKVLAFAGNFQDNGLVPVAEENDIAMAEPYPFALDVGASANVFSFTCPVRCQIQALATYAKNEGILKKGFGYVYNPGPISDDTVARLTAFFQTIGVKFVAIPISVSQASMTPVVAELQSQDIDMVFNTGGPNIITGLIDAANQLGYQPQFAGAQNLYDQNVLSTLDGRADGALLAWNMRPWDDAAASQLRTTLDAYGGGSYSFNYAISFAWYSGNGLIQAVKSIPSDTEITRKSILDAMRTLTYSDPMLPATVDFSKTPGPCGDAARAPSDSLFIMRIDGDKFSYAKDATPVNGCSNG